MKSENKERHYELEDLIESDKDEQETIDPFMGSALAGGCLGGVALAVTGGILGYMGGGNINDYLEISNEIGRRMIEISSFIGGVSVGFFGGLHLGAYTLGPILLWSYEKYERKILEKNRGRKDENS